MVICSAEQFHEWVGQLPHADPSGSSFLQSSCHGEGDGWALHRQRAIAKNMCIPRDTRFPFVVSAVYPGATLSREQKVYPR